MNIARWIKSGDENFAEQGLTTTEELLEAAGRLLDKSCSHEIVGEVLFVGSDGKTYVGTVEFVIAEANPSYVDGVINNDDELTEEQAEELKALVRKQPHADDSGS